MRKVPVHEEPHEELRFLHTIDVMEFIPAPPNGLPNIKFIFPLPERELYYDGMMFRFFGLVCNPNNYMSFRLEDENNFKTVFKSMALQFLQEVITWDFNKEKEVYPDDGEDREKCDTYLLTLVQDEAYVKWDDDQPIFQKDLLKVDDDNMCLMLMLMKWVRTLE